MYKRGYFYEFHKATIDELEDFDYDEYINNEICVEKLKAFV